MNIRNMKAFLIVLLIAAIFGAGCTAGKSKTDQDSPEQHETQGDSTKIESDSGNSQPGNGTDDKIPPKEAINETYESDEFSNVFRELLANGNTQELQVEITISGIYLGMSESELQANIEGDPVIANPGGNYKKYDYEDGIEIFLSPFNQRNESSYYGINHIKVTTSKYKTKRGLTVGMEESLITQCYGEPDNQYTYDGYTIFEYTIDPHGAEGLYFEVKNNQIVDFYLTTTV